eukprot:scaffold115274_cov17-Tisochrysis_lutea.AAC.1
MQLAGQGRLAPDLPCSQTKGAVRPSARSDRRHPLRHALNTRYLPIWWNKLCKGSGDQASPCSASSPTEGLSLLTEQLGSLASMNYVVKNALLGFVRKFSNLLVVSSHTTARCGTLPIPGAKDAKQMEDIAGAIGWRLSDGEMAELDKFSSGIPASTGAPFEKW